MFRRAVNFLVILYLSLLSVLCVNGKNNTAVVVNGAINGIQWQHCAHFRNSSRLDVKEMVGFWITAYSQPKDINCFTLNIRATTELEREQNAVKYGTFDRLVDWNYCLLELQSPLGKHYLQGNGSEAGLLRNVIISTFKNGTHVLVEQDSDQWSLYGRRGRELLFMRDCGADALTVFARAPYWPTSIDVYAVLHRNDIIPLSSERNFCKHPLFPVRRCTTGEL